MSVLTKEKLKLFCFIADFCEAKALLQNFYFKKQEGNNLYQYESKQFLLDVCILNSWGEAAVMCALQNYPQALTSYDLWLNIGFAGACNPSIPLQKCFLIKSLRKSSSTDPKCLTQDPALILNTIGTTLPSNTLVTAEAPYTLGFHNTFQLIDMEGYMIASLAKQYQQPLSMLKIISDYTIPRRDDFIKKQSPQLATKLAETFMTHLFEIVAVTHCPMILEQTAL
ncbi:hypothetical protein [Chlamydia sp. 17-3921]|uniref:hypothetical protein n=1 Tax=Chlamydia sp. 17-3921 TaxID=2675798 RepID=UPI00191843FB|nr:hypothetical protein [Chlamydia sp. 17-3921]